MSEISGNEHDPADTEPVGGAEDLPAATASSSGANAEPPASDSGDSTTTPNGASTFPRPRFAVGDLPPDWGFGAGAKPDDNSSAPPASRTAAKFPAPSKPPTFGLEAEATPRGAPGFSMSASAAPPPPAPAPSPVVQGGPSPLPDSAAVPSPVGSTAATTQQKLHEQVQGRIDAIDPNKRAWLGKVADPVASPADITRAEALLRANPDTAFVAQAIGRNADLRAQYLDAGRAATMAKLTQGDAAQEALADRQVGMAASRDLWRIVNRAPVADGKRQALQKLGLVSEGSDETGRNVPKVTPDGVRLLGPEEQRAIGRALSDPANPVRVERESSTPQNMRPTHSQEDSERGASVFPEAPATQSQRYVVNVTFTPKDGGAVVTRPLSVLAQSETDATAKAASYARDQGHTVRATEVASRPPVPAGETDRSAEPSVPETKPIPDSGFLPSAAGALQKDFRLTAAAGIDAVTPPDNAEIVQIAKRQLDLVNQRIERQQQAQRVFGTNSWAKFNGALGAVPGLSPEAQLQHDLQLRDRLQKVYEAAVGKAWVHPVEPNSTTEQMQRYAQAARDSAAQAYSEQGADEHSQNWTAKVGRGAGHGTSGLVMSAVPGAGGALAAAQAVGTAYESAYGDEEARQRAAGETDAEKIRSAAEQAGTTAAMRQLPYLVASHTAGNVAGRVADRIAPAASPWAASATRAAANAAANTAANTGIRALEHLQDPGVPVLPTLEEFASNIVSGAGAEAVQASRGGDVEGEGEKQTGRASPEDTNFAARDAAAAESREPATPTGKNDEVSHPMQSQWAASGIEKAPEVHAVREPDELPEQFADEIDREPMGSGSRLEAYFITTKTPDGETKSHVIVFPDAVAAVAQDRGISVETRLRQIAAHEIVHHYASVGALLPEAGRIAYARTVDGLMDRIQKEDPAEFSHLTASREDGGYGYDPGSAEGRESIVEEYLARFNEKGGPAPGLVARAYAQFRRLLRQFVPGLEWTDNDVRSLLDRARRSANENEAEPQSRGLRMSLQPADDSGREWGVYDMSKVRLGQDLVDARFDIPRSNVAVKDQDSNLPGDLRGGQGGGVETSSVGGESMGKNGRNPQRKRTRLQGTRRTFHCWKCENGTGSGPFGHDSNDSSYHPQCHGRGQCRK